MNWILIVIGNILEGCIIWHFWTTLLERRYNKKTSALIFVPCFVLNLIKNYVIFDNVALRSVLTNIVFLIMMQIMFKDKWYKKVIVHTIYLLCIIPAECLAIVFSKYVYHFDMVNLNELTLPCLLWQGTVYVLIFIFSMIAILLLNRKRLDLENKVTQYVFLYAAVQCLMLFAVTMFVFQYKIMSAIMIGFIFAIIIASVILGIMIYKAVKTAAVKSAEAEYIKKENEIKDKHFAELKAQYVEYRRLRHDYINHLRIIKELNDPEKLREYTQAIEEKFEKMGKVSFCDNLAVDALLSLKNNEAVKQEVDASFEVCSLEDCSIGDFDLCVVIANLLDNAIEGASKTKDGYMHMKIVRKAERIIITAKNSAPVVDMNLKTSKKNADNHGIGIDNIREIAQKHDGEYIAKYENGEFTGIVNMKC